MTIFDVASHEIVNVPLVVETVPPKSMLPITCRVASVDGVRFTIAASVADSVEAVHCESAAPRRVWSLAVLVSAGLAVFFAVAWLVGALDKDLMAQLRRRPKAPAAG